MQLEIINTPPCKYDGGPTFGVVPKVLWGKNITADENNMVYSGMRCLLVIDGDRKILIDTGIGTKLNDKVKSHFCYSDTQTLQMLLADKDFTPNDITDVVFTHLHFDHVGGATIINSEEQAVPLFPKAKHWVSSQQWEHALQPNAREKASYYPENYMPLYENNLLHFIDKNTFLTPNIELRLYSGHTLGQIAPFIRYKEHTLVFMGDFIPMAFHIPIPYVAGFDTQPILAMQEKETFLEEAVQENYTLFFEHDYENECATLKGTDKGIRLDKVFKLADIL